MSPALRARLEPAEARALEQAMGQARRGRGLAAPNPMVGAVVLRGDELVGRGHHEHARREHAEIAALRDAGERARGSTLVVSLEPCSSRGRTGPCTEAIVEAGIRRVVAAVPDPDPRHRGRGLALLREAGVDVAWAPPEAGRAALELNAHFACWRLTGRPFVTLKAASSLDGRTAARSGESKWITGESARRAAHEARLDHAAILTGVGTVLADDPRMSVRLPDRPESHPLRCVLDPRLRSPPSARCLSGGIVFASEIAPGDPELAPRCRGLEDAGSRVVSVPADASGRLDLHAVLAHLGGEREINGVLVEGGGITSGRFLAAGLGDALLAHLAPALLGGDGTAASFAGFGAEGLADARRLQDLRVRRIGEDLEVRARLEGGFDVGALHAELEALAAAAAP